MIIRRLVKAGQASHTISLPKEWLDKHNLKKGDLVYLFEKSDKELMITPENKPEEQLPAKEIIIPVDNKEFSTIQREITSAYINNYNTITLSGDQLTEKAKDIRKMLHDFVALEVADHTAKSIVVRNFKRHKIVQHLTDIFSFLRQLIAAERYSIVIVDIRACNLTLNSAELLVINRNYNLFRWKLFFRLVLRRNHQLLIALLKQIHQITLFQIMLIEPFLRKRNRMRSLT